MNYFHKTVNSPGGKLIIISSELGLAAILWENDKPNRVRRDHGIENKQNPILIEVEEQLTEYFQRRRQVFSLPLDPVGTEFQKKVWRELSAIPFGKTLSYAEIAKKIGNPNASRAVGAANGRNPFSIVVPCHRVIGANGALTGFAGGIKIKAQLLSLESNNPKEEKWALK